MKELIYKFLSSDYEVVAGDFIWQISTNLNTHFFGLSALLSKVFALTVPETEEYIESWCEIQDKDFNFVNFTNESIHLIDFMKRAKEFYSSPQMNSFIIHNKHHKEAKFLLTLSVRSYLSKEEFYRAIIEFKLISAYPNLLVTDMVIFRDEGNIYSADKTYYNINDIVRFLSDGKTIFIYTISCVRDNELCYILNFKRGEEPVDYKLHTFI